MKPSLKARSAVFLLENKLDARMIERAFRARSIHPSTELNYVNRSNIKLAAVQLKLRPYHSLSELVEHLQDLVEEAQEQGAQLISFPEYVGLLPLLLSPALQELAEDFFSCLEEENYADCRDILAFFSEHLSDLLFTCYYNIFALLANRSRLYIHAGSTILRSEGKLVERCFLFGPDGETVLEQDKLFLSPQELAVGLQPGEELELCDSPLGRIAILPGRDSYYFESAKVAAQLGAQIVLCPLSPTEEDNEMAERCGPWMRCQEQPLYAAVPRLVGEVKPFRFKGKAAIFAPYEATRTFKTGIVSQLAQNDEDGVLFSRINLDYLHLPTDPYCADENPQLYEQLSAAYSDFPTPLERLEPLDSSNN